MFFCKQIRSIRKFLIVVHRLKPALVSGFQIFTDTPEGAKPLFLRKDLFLDGKKAQAPRLISYSRLASWYVFVLAFLYFFHFSFLGEYTSHHIAQKIQFMTREWLGATPPLHPRIKIYAHDDRAVHEFKRADISLSMWGTIVETISRSGPSMIIIDKKFGVINDQSEADQFIEKLNTSAPVLVGGFTLAKGINDIFFAESLLNESRKEYL